MADLRSGRGMSLALAAELNGFPGPAHVLELAEQLDLSAEQRQRTQALFMQMGQRARELGELVIAAEAELDRLFKNSTADAASVDDSTAKIARLQGCKASFAQHTSVSTSRWWRCVVPSRPRGTTAFEATPHSADVAELMRTALGEWPNRTITPISMDARRAQLAEALARD